MANSINSFGPSGTVALEAFFDKQPTAKPVVTGSRATTAVATSMLAALVQLGLVTDSTSA